MMQDYLLLDDYYFYSRQIPVEYSILLFCSSLPPPCLSPPLPSLICLFPFSFTSFHSPFLFPSLPCFFTCLPFEFSLSYIFSNHFLFRTVLSLSSLFYMPLFFFISPHTPSLAVSFSYSHAFLQNSNIIYCQDISTETILFQAPNTAEVQ